MNESRYSSSYITPARPELSFPFIAYGIRSILSRERRIEKTDQSKDPMFNLTRMLEMFNN